MEVFFWIGLFSVGATVAGAIWGIIEGIRDRIRGKRTLTWEDFL